jgi:hypothetical protein
VARLWDSALSFLLLASGDKLLRFSNTILRSTVQDYYGEDTDRARMLQVLYYTTVLYYYGEDTDRARMLQVGGQLWQWQWQQ